MGSCAFIQSNRLDNQEKKCIVFFSILAVMAVLMIVGTVELINDFEERSKGNMKIFS